MLTRRRAIGALAAPLMGQGRRPNMVFILVDDLRWDGLGCTGHAFAQTPHIDRLAKEGATFRNAFVTTPLCSPSRGSYLTGRYVHAHGVIDNTDRGELSHRLTTFPKLLKDAGYATAYVGKWHMGRDDSPRPGFDRWVSFKGQGVYNDPEINIDGKSAKINGYMTDILGEHGVEFASRKHAKPFCLYLAHKAVHGPFTPAERHKSDFASNAIERAANAKDTLESKPAMTRIVDGSPAVRPGGGSGDELIRNQMRCMRSVDDSVGALVSALEKTGQLDNTLILFTSDNGYFWGEHGLGDKRWAYEESIRIPMIARYPKLIKAGTALDQDVLNIDVAPTMLDLAGVARPADMHGRSVLPLLKNNRAPWRREFLAEYFEETQFKRAPAWQAVRGGGWKYIHYGNLDGMDELYDLKADPQEMRNRIGDAGARPKLDQMKLSLARLLKESQG
jgi:N-acetylglucosamine-6-sulfatase